MAPLIFQIIGYALCFVVLSAITAFIAYTLYIHHQHEKYRHIPGPKRANFYLGNIPQFAETKSFSKQIHAWRLEFGPIFTMCALHSVVVVCCDTAAIKELMTRSKYPKDEKQYRPFHSLFGARSLGKGLVSETDHEVWARKRALFNPAFHRKYLMGLMEPFNTAADQLTNHLMQYADGKTEVTMLHEFGRITLDIIGRVGFGIKEDVITNPNHQLCHLVPHLAMGMQAMYSNPLLELSPLPSHLRYKREMRETAHRMRALGRECIEARMRAIEAGEEVPSDILTYILDASNNLQEASFGMEDMIDEFCTFFAAGQETTANLLSFCLLHLGHNPDVLSRLKKEIDSVVGGKDFIDFSDVGKLQYLTLVLKESLRLNGPIGGSNRRVLEDTELCGYTVPKGSTVVLPMFTMGRHEDHFKNPLTFDPERFTRDDDKPLFAYFPFSIGPRSCIGQAFAMIEMKVIIAKLLSRYDFCLVPGQDLDFQEELTMKPKDGCKTFISLR
ncbi:cholesterol 24-hydroxylase-like [Diadema setosum]|uniref:cholesterol 24-hydroxylase-like n=1 Tax=Diadema setosum TaxID=31175 RepID=UPI003B3BC6D1